MFLDNDWRFVDLNRQAESALGMKRSELIGRVYWDVFPQAVGSEFHNKVDTAMKKQIPVHFEEYSKAGQKWMESHVYPSEDGLAFYLRDITERKQAEEALQRRTEELTITNRYLESFSYSISHDLRAPLRAMKGFISIILDDFSDKLDAEVQNYCNRIAHNADKMSELIDDILNLSKVSRQEVYPQYINLSAIAAAVVDELRQADPSNKVAVTIEEHIEACGDSRLMNIVLSNLIGNAWKYSSKTHDARIEVGKMGQEERAIYYVRDNGAGFDMKFADRLFEPFKRLHSDKEFPGTGIGLAIVKRVIEKHRGAIWAESEPGHGATFYFTLSVDR